MSLPATWVARDSTKLTGGDGDVSPGRAYPEIVFRYGAGDVTAFRTDEKHGPAHGRHAVELARENEAFAPGQEGYAMNVCHGEAGG